MSNVKEITPSNIKSIPAMLPAELEAGREPMPRTALLVLVQDGNSVPVVAAFGDELSRLEEIGALHVAAQMSLQMELVPENG